MKKFGILLIAITGLLLVSCATTQSYPSVSHFTEFAPGSLPENRYIVLGEISVENTVIVATDDITKEMANEIAVEKKLLTVKVHGDDGKYGFIGKPAKVKLSVFERADALAEYKLIELARFNKADAIICFNSSTEIMKDGANSILTTKASGLAVRIKADEGYSIEYPAPETWNAADFEYTEEEMAAEAAAEATGDTDEVESVE